MHKDEASVGLAILSNPNRVKIAEFLYVNGTLSYDDLLYIIGDEGELNDSLRFMEEGSLIVKNDANSYSINKDCVDSLL